MREMNAVVAGGVIPAAVDIHGAMAAGQGEMTIGAIHVAAGSLPFEVEEDVGQGRPFQHVVLNLEAAGTDCIVADYGAQHVMPRRAERREIRLPIRKVSPMIYFAGR